jgi:cytochrome c biogenesis protein
LADFMERNVPQAERARAGEMLVRILNGVLYELEALAREQAGAKPMPAEQVPAFMTQAVLALSDITLYPAPMALMLKDFTQVQASVFQVARAPGKTLVYLGCALLILGVFSMLYVRERRVWVWLAPQADAAQSQATMALSTNRKTLDGDQEFVHLTRKLLGNEAPTV